MTTAQTIIDILELERHPEGGWYVQTFRDGEGHGDRAHSTAIYYLLEGGDRSHWHTVDAVEIWHSHAGAPLELSLSEDGASERKLLLGADLSAGERPLSLTLRALARITPAISAPRCAFHTAAPHMRREGSTPASEDSPAGAICVFLVRVTEGTT